MKKLSLKDLTKGTKAFSYGDRLRPQRDWLALLGLTILLIAGSVVWNLWLFSKVTSGEQIGDAAVSESQKTTQIEQAMVQFDERAQEEARYLNEYRFVDPSGPGR